MSDNQKPARNRISLYQAREPAPAVVQAKRASKGHSSPPRKRSRSRRVWRTVFRVLVLLTIFGLALFTGLLYLAHRASLRPVSPLPSAETGLPPGGSEREDASLVRSQVWAMAQEAKRAETTVADVRGMVSRGMREEPIQRLRRQLERTPNHVAVLHALGDLLLTVGDAEEATRVFATALQANPESAQLRLRFGQALLLSADHEGALDAARWVLESEPGWIEAHRIAVRAALALDAPDIALRHVRRILDRKDDDVEAWKTLPVVFLRQGEYGRAILTLNEIIRRNWAGKEDYFNLAIAFALQGQVEDTVDTLSAAALQWDVPTVFAWLSSNEFEKVRPDVRFQTLERQLERNLSAAPTVLRPDVEPAEHVRMGLLPEPDFLDIPAELRPR